MFPKIVVPQNGWFIRENPIKMDYLEGKPTIFGNTHIPFVPMDDIFAYPSAGKLRSLGGVAAGQTIAMHQRFCTSSSLGIA